MLTVKDIMTQPAAVIRSSATIENAILLMQAKQVQALIVDKCCISGRYGILSEKDIVHKVIARGDVPSRVYVGSIMQQQCTQVPAGVTIQEAAKILAEAGLHRAPVTEHERLLGMVSVTDILVKGHVGIQPQEALAQRIQEALQYQACGIDDGEAEISQECRISLNFARAHATL